MSKWTPIAGAPRDGTRFIGRAPYFDSKGVRRYRKFVTWWGKASHVPLYGWCHGRVESVDLWNPVDWTPNTNRPDRELRTEDPSTFAARFWARTVRRESGCIEWIGNRTRQGYGRLTSGGKYLAAHRVAYELTIGAIKRGILVCHKCDNPPCVNPEHLFLGTHEDNNHDCVRKGRERHLRGEERYNAKLNDSIVADIKARRLRPDQTREIAALARELGVTDATVRHVIIGRTWRHVQVV